MNILVEIIDRLGAYVTETAVVHVKPANVSENNFAGYLRAVSDNFLDIANAEKDSVLSTQVNSDIN